MDRSSSAETASIEEITSKSRLLVPPTLSLPLTIQHPTIYPRSALLQNLGLLSDPNLTSALTASILHQNALAPQLQNPLLGFQNRGRLFLMLLLEFQLRVTFLVKIFDILFIFQFPFGIRFGQKLVEKAARCDLQLNRRTPSKNDLTLTNI